MTAQKTPPTVAPSLSPDLEWTDDGAPRSSRFGDIYFSSQDGLAESLAVFLQGCGLPAAWSGRSQFVVGELGFGTGLNILALLNLWRETRTPTQRLSIFSVEAYPLTQGEARRALGAWPALGDLAERLTAAWPRRAAGFHRVQFEDLNATLDLAIGDAAWALEQWGGRADAWFLDGFSPATNPLMWSEAVLAGVAARTTPGGVAATFTVAGAVRRGLQARGFTVEKRSGHGRKRERLEARLPGDPVPGGPLPRIAIIGAGVAGAALARALRVLGIEAVIVDPGGPGAGASGNPAALVTPALDAGGGVRARLYAQAFARATDLYQALGEAAVVQRGVVQLEQSERDAARFDAVAASGLFEDGAVTRLDAEAAASRLGEPISTGGLAFADGLSIRPSAVLKAWIGDGPVIRTQVAALERVGARWRLLNLTGEVVLVVDGVCIAAGAGVGDLDPGGRVQLNLIRGQASWVSGVNLPRPATWGGYAIPFDGQILFGATHNRDRADVDLDPGDHQRNLTALAQALPRAAEAAKSRPWTGRASLRAATRDFLPAAGAIGGDGGAEGLFVLAGLGSRGFTTAPLLAEHVAALIAGAPSPLPVDLSRAVDPARLEKWRATGDNAACPTAC